MALGKKTGGRQRGSVNKRTQAVTERLQAMGCDPITSMAKLAQQAEKEKDWQLAGRMYGELANYVAPKRKAIEKETVHEPISMEDATKEAIDFIVRAPDKVRRELLEALGIEETQCTIPTEEMTERRRRLNVVK